MMGDLLLGAPTMGTHGAIGAFVDDVSAVTFIDAFDASRDNGSRIQLVTNRADVNSCYIQLLKRVDGEFILLGEFALATPPQEFDLPLAEPYDGKGKYLKTQENIVIVNVNIGTTGGSEISNNNMTFATLPAGFRPSGIVYSDAVTLNSTTGKVVGVAQFSIDANGSLNLRVPSGSYRLRGELIFLAAD